MSINRTITIGVGADTPCDTTQDDWFWSCRDLQQQAAVYWLQLLSNSSDIWSLRHRVDVEIIPSGDVSSGVMAHYIRTGALDFYPYPVTVNNVVRDDFHLTSAVDFTALYMYSHPDSSSNLYQDSPFTFLAKPFRWDTWLLAAFFACIIYVILTIDERMRHVTYTYQQVSLSQIDTRIRKGKTTARKTYAMLTSRFVEFATFIAFAAFTFIYSVQLKAVVTYTKPIPPFRDLIDLSVRINDRKMKMIVESVDTLRYRLLMKQVSDFDDPYHRSASVWRPLVDAIRRTPGSMLLADSTTELCEMLKERSDVVFFGYETLLVSRCPNICVWRYRVTEYPDTLRTLIMAKDSEFVQLADMYSSAIVSYRQLLSKRFGLPTNCDHSNQLDRSLIGMPSLASVFFFIILSWILCSIVFLFERLYYLRVSKSRFYAVIA